MSVCLRPCTCNQNFYEYLIKTNECILCVCCGRAGTEKAIERSLLHQHQPTSTSSGLGHGGCHERDERTQTKVTAANTNYSEVRNERNSEEFGEPESAHTSAGGSRRRSSRRSFWVFVLPKQQFLAGAIERQRERAAKIRPSGCMYVFQTRHGCCTLLLLLHRFRLVVPSAPRYGLYEACLVVSRGARQEKEEKSV